LFGRFLASPEKGAIILEIERFQQVRGLELEHGIARRRH